MPAQFGNKTGNFEERSMKGLSLSVTPANQFSDNLQIATQSIVKTFILHVNRSFSLVPNEGSRNRISMQIKFVKLQENMTQTVERTVPQSQVAFSNPKQNRGEISRNITQSRKKCKIYSTRNGASTYYTGSAISICVASVTQNRTAGLLGW